MFRFAPLAEIAPHTLDALLDRAFGVERHARTAYKIRAGVDPIASLSFARIEDGALAGVILCWPVVLTGDDGSSTPLVMVGPVAVDPPLQNQGLGHALMAHMLDAAARERLDDRLMLIGDPEYYGRFFGFTAARTAGWRLPGPLDPRRLLARGAATPAIGGMLGPRASA